MSIPLYDAYSEVRTISQIWSRIPPEKKKSALKILQSWVPKNIKSADQAGNTWLHRAVQDKDIFLTQYLISFRAEFNRKNAKGHTAKDLARELGLKQNICWDWYYAAERIRRFLAPRNLAPHHEED